MRILIFILFTASYVFSQGNKIPLFSDDLSVKVGEEITVRTKPDSTFLYDVPVLYTLIWNDNIPITPKIISKSELKFTVPNDVILNNYNKLTIDVDDGPNGEIFFYVIPKEDISLDSLIKGDDPNPDTQNGTTHNLGDDPKPITNNPITISNPSGGHNKPSGVPCQSLHNIDGTFTRFEDSQYNEWSGIIPQRGKFSRLYIDFCDSTMYLLNDWHLADSLPHSTCYNLFEFYTGSGKQHWKIKIFQDLNKPMEVYLDGVEVSNDTNVVIGGLAGFDVSPQTDYEHTIYEFAVKVIPGTFYIPSLGDPVMPLFPKTICDENGYGIVRDPNMFVGNFGRDGTTLKRYKRYIPISEIPGLIKEPNYIIGNLGDELCYRYSQESNDKCTKCIENRHIVDGEFSENEWTSTPAVGKYSDFYAEYCDSIVYVLNDWKVANLEADSRSCYNLFEMFSGSGSEHWGIYVYQDKEKGIKVFRNGVDVSDSSYFVEGGAYGFKSKEETDEANAIYEFGIRTLPGDFMLFLADPGPSSFCDEDYKRRPAPRDISHDVSFSSSDVPEINKNGLSEYFGDTLTLSLDSKFNVNDFNSIIIENFEIEVRYNKYHFFPFVEAIKTKTDCNDCLDIEINEDEYNNHFNILKIISTLDSQITVNDMIEIPGMLLAFYDTVSSLSTNIKLKNKTSILYNLELDDFNLKSIAKTKISELLIESFSLINKSNLLIYDNLELKVHTNNSNPIYIKIYNELGQLVDQFNIPEITVGINKLNFNFSEYNTGLYYIKLQQNDKFLNSKVVRVK